MSSSSSSVVSAPSSGYGPITLEELGQLHPLRAQRYRLLSELDDWLDLGQETSVNIAKIVANYVQDAVAFGPRDYRTHYGVDVGDDVLPEENRIWWNSLDAITPFDAQGNPIYNYETHHGFHYIPVSYRAFPNPHWLTPGINQQEEVPMDIENHDLLAAEPEVGHPSEFRDPSNSLSQNKNIRPATSCWVAQRKQVLFRNESTSKQRALIQELNTETEVQMQAMGDQLGTCYGTLTGTRYENLPDLRDLSIIARNHFAKTAERILGDDTGAERRWTFSRTEQKFRQETRNEQGVLVRLRVFQVTVGGLLSLEVGNLGLFSHIPYSKEIGVAGLRKSNVK